MTHGPVYSGKDRARDAALLRQRMQAVAGESEISDRLKIITTVVLAFVAVWLALTQLSPWSLSLTYRHLLSAAGCGMASRMDLAPARRGEPGYWPHLDPDGDGVACKTRKYHAG